MAYCPNCATPLTADAAACPKCRAVFAPGSAWAPVDTAPKPEPERDVVSTVFMRLLVLVAAGLVVAALAFVAMFATFSNSRAAAPIYFLLVLLALGAVWAVYPIFESLTRRRKPKNEED